MALSTQKSKRCLKCNETLCRHLSRKDMGSGGRTKDTKLRIPKKGNNKELMKIRILKDNGFSFDGGWTREYWNNDTYKLARPQRFSELEDFLYTNGVIDSHKEYKKLINKYR